MARGTNSVTPRKVHTVAELLAIYAATSAAVALLKAIHAFENASFSPDLALPLREALAAIEASIHEVQP